LLYRWRLPGDDLCQGLPKMSPVELAGETLDKWLALWAATLAKRTSAVPMIRPPAQPMTTRRRVTLSAAIAAVLLLGCLAHYWWFARSVAALQAQAEQADRPRREMAELIRKATPLETKLKQLDPNTSASGGTDPLLELASQKERIPSLLKALAVLADEDRVVTRLSAESRGGVTVEGTCLRPELADSLAVGLGQELGGRRWVIRGAQKNARLAAPDGGPWDFRVTLSPQPPQPAQPAATPAGAVVGGGPK
jgi:hypothetical protein